MAQAGTLAFVLPGIAGVGLILAVVGVLGVPRIVDGQAGTRREGEERRG